MLSRIYKYLPPIAQYNSVTAGMIDKTYLDNPQGWTGKLWKFTKLRGFYLLFTASSIADVITAAVLSARYAIGAALRIDDVQDRRIREQIKYNTLFSKNLLALLTSPLGLINPELITIHFVPEFNLPGIRAGGNYYHAPEVKVAAPSDIESLQAIIHDAARNGQKIMPIGAGRSQGKQFIPEGDKGIIIDLKNFNTIQINSKKKTAIIGAGVRWADLQIEANKHKLALQVMQASNVFSAGGSVGINVYGWKHDKGMLSNTILAMDIINAQGELQTLTPQDELFHAITGGLGLLGIVVSIKLQLTDNELLKEYATSVANTDYVQHFYHNVIANPNVRMHLFRLSLDPKNLLGMGIAVDYIKEAGTVPCITPNLTAERPHGKREERIVINLAHEIAKVRNLWWKQEEKRLLNNTTAPLSTNAIMQPPINAMFTPARNEAEWLQEYFLPGEKLADFLQSLGQLLMQNKVALLNASVRFVKQNPLSPMSYAYAGDRFAVVLCWNQSLHEKKIIQAQKWLRAAQHLAVNLGGSYYLPYQHITAIDDFAVAYPHVNEFLKIKQQVDPANLFVSCFYQKYMAPRPCYESHIKAIIQNKNNQVEFSGFLQNVLQRVEAKDLYVLMEDILQYKDTDEEIYSELCQRLPEILPSRIATFRRILHSLATIKHDLSEQAKFLLPNIKEIDGLVEIGYPGRFIAGFKKQFTVKGKIIAVVDQVGITDYIQTGFPAPYHEFKPLNYSKPNLAELTSHSADVITCYVGLHHFPDNEVDVFLQDVRRVLRPGGHFLLVDHDVVNEKYVNYAKGAHTFFNAVNGVSVREEMQETRNFHPMSYWINLLAKHDLGYSVSGADVPLIREGDPSRNRMVCFVKPKLTQVLTTEIQSIPEKEYKPSLIQRSLFKLKGNTENTQVANGNDRKYSSELRP